LTIVSRRCLERAVPPQRRTSGRLARAGSGLRRRDCAGLRSARGQLRLLAVVDDVEGFAILQHGRWVAVCHRHPYCLALRGSAKAQLPQWNRQSWLEVQHPVHIAYPTESHEQRDPGPGERCQMHTVISVVREVLEVDERRLAEIVVREIHVPDLG